MVFGWISRSNPEIPPIGGFGNQKAISGEFKQDVEIFETDVSNIAKLNLVWELVRRSFVFREMAEVQMVKLFEQCGWNLGSPEFAEFLVERSHCFSSTQLVDGVGTLRFAQKQIGTNFRMTPTRMYGIVLKSNLLQEKHQYVLLCR